MSGLVLAAGSSQRLGQAKQLLPYRGATLLDTTLDMARRCGFDQLIVAVGGASAEVLETVNFAGADVVENVHHTTGCSSSIVAALDTVSPAADGIVLLLGDQPHVAPEAVRSLVQAAARAPLAVCHYNDGRGHPFWFGRAAFGDLLRLRGDKAVWKLLESGIHEVLEVEVGGDIPLDVDTWHDYEALLAQNAAGS
ncbi:MAG: NTP transferase domain-containing protein [Acidimicrobiales bacterium]